MIRVKTENVVILKDGRKVEIRKIENSKVLLRFEGFRTSIRITIDEFNQYAEEKDRI